MYNSENNNREIEVRFLEIDQEALIKRLKELGAKDEGEDFFQEVIFYDDKLQWRYKDKKFVRLRRGRNGATLTFKHNEMDTAEGTKEIEFGVDNFEQAKEFLVETGLIAFREQEKKRHSFKLGDVVIDIDTWPAVPTYVELEGPSEAALQAAAAQLGLDWATVVFESPRYVIEKNYHIPVSEFHYFTFDKQE